MTAATLYRRCRQSDITLAADGESIRFDAPADAEVPVEEIRKLKPELLAVLGGEYLHAALELVLRVPDPDERQALADLFDERAAVCQYDGGMSRGEAERVAYGELARAVDARDQSISLDVRRWNSRDGRVDEGTT